MRSRQVLILSVVVLSLLSLSFTPRSTEPPAATMTLYVVDVGMGDAIFVDVPPNNCMLVDAGSWDPDGIERLTSFLGTFFRDPNHAAYDSTIDIVVATHQDADHIKGMTSVLKTFRVGTYIDNGVGCKFGKAKPKSLIAKVESLLVQKNIPHKQITDSLILADGTNGEISPSWLDPSGPVKVAALAGTPSPKSNDANDNTIVLKVTNDKVSFLLMGDATDKEERRMIARLQGFNKMIALDVDVIKVGHHGSPTSSTLELLQAASPKMSVISVGEAAVSGKTRKFRLPKQSAVQRIDSLTSERLDEEWTAEMFPDNKKSTKPKLFTSYKAFYFTSADGTIKFTTNGTNINVELLEEGEH